MGLREGAKVKEEKKNNAPPEKEANHKIEQRPTYQEWVDALLADPTLKTIYEKEVAKRKK